MIGTQKTLKIGRMASQTSLNPPQHRDIHRTTSVESSGATAAEPAEAGGGFDDGVGGRWKKSLSTISGKSDEAKAKSKLMAVIREAWPTTT